MSFLLVLTGCDCFAEDSVNQEKLKEIKIREYKYLKYIYDDQWDDICVLVPYQGAVSPKDSVHAEFYNNKIYEAKIANDHDDGYWYLIYKREEKFHYEKIPRANYLDIEQRRFSEIVDRSYKKLGFKPKGCANLSSGEFYKFEESLKEDLRTYITLGEI